MKVTCTNTRVLYLLECNRCGKHYVGQTTKRRKDRIANHFKVIRHPNSKCALAHHYRKKPPGDKDPHTPEDIRVVILGGVAQSYDQREAEELLKEMETKWICKLNSLRSNGLNYKLSDDQVRTSLTPQCRASRARERPVVN